MQKQGDGVYITQEAKTVGMEYIFPPHLSLFFPNNHIMIIPYKSFQSSPSVPNCTKVQYIVPRHISVDPNIRFSWNSPDSKIAIRQIICSSLGEFLCAKFEISLQTQENISNMWFGVVPRHKSVDPNIRFSWNSPDSKIAMKRILDNLCEFGRIYMCQIWDITKNTRKYLQLCGLEWYQGIYL